MDTTTLFIKRLTILDCSYLCPQRGILGETWWADVELQGGLDEEGVVFDFSYAKKTIKTLIDELADHKLLLPLQDNKLSCEQENDIHSLKYSSTNAGYLEYSCPKQGIAPIATPAITAESVARYLEEVILPKMPKNVLKVSIKLYNEPLDTPSYHYSHGLRKHYGNCQRLLHGHRSLVEIFQNGQRSQELEEQWCKRWTDIYLYSKEDLLEKTTVDGIPYLRIGYTSQQGTFQALIQEKVCDELPTDTTVEWISHFISSEVQKLCPNDDIFVIAYEGIDKGAKSK